MILRRHASSRSAFVILSRRWPGRADQPEFPLEVSLPVEPCEGRFVGGGVPVGSLVGLGVGGGLELGAGLGSGLGEGVTEGSGDGLGVGLPDEEACWARAAGAADPSRTAARTTPANEMRRSRRSQERDREGIGSGTAYPLLAASTWGGRATS